MLALYFANIFNGQGLISSIALALWFYGIPAALTFHVWNSSYTLDNDAASLVVSTFSIFAALLFSAQIAAYSVFSSSISSNSKSTTHDEIESELLDKRAADISRAFRKINAGISMLTFLSILVLILVFSILELKSFGYERLTLVPFSFLVSHFLLFLLHMCYQVFLFFDFAYLGES